LWSVGSPRRKWNPKYFRFCCITQNSVLHTCTVWKLRLLRLALSAADKSDSSVTDRLRHAKTFELLPARTTCPEKRAQFSLHNFNKCRHSYGIFGMNHPEKNSFYSENRTRIPNIIISLRSDDVIVTSSETTLSRTVSG